MCCPLVQLQVYLKNKQKYFNKRSTLKYCFINQPIFAYLIYEFVNIYFGQFNQQTLNYCLIYHSSECK